MLHYECPPTTALRTSIRCPLLGSRNGKLANLCLLTLNIIRNKLHVAILVPYFHGKHFANSMSGCCSHYSFVTSWIFFPRVTLEQPCTSFLLSLPLVSFSKPWNQSCPSYLKPKRVLILQLIHSGTEIPFVANSEDTPMK